MGLVVQKFGGTSVKDLARIRHVAEHVCRTRAEGHQVVVVVSAMAGETNRLIDLAHSVTPRPDSREFDQLIATGEQVTVSLLALALQNLGVSARSFLGHQARILTNSSYSQARILGIDESSLRAPLAQGVIPVVAGFQGVDLNGNITTLGRGGSDTTAVAVAAALKADVCEIYTDVDGVYSADPRLCPRAVRWDEVSLDEMMEMASCGAKVLQIRSVFFAAKYKVPLVVRSSFEEGKGTRVVPKEVSVEDVVVTGIALDESQSKVVLKGLQDQPGVASEVFLSLAERDINVDMIVQNVSNEGLANITFTVPTRDLDKTEEVLSALKDKLSIGQIHYDRDVAKVSAVGLGMKTQAGVAARFFQTLGKCRINMDLISTSEIRISVVVRRSDGAPAVRALHEAFGLDRTHE